MSHYSCNYRNFGTVEIKHGLDSGPGRYTTSIGRGQVANSNGMINHDRHSPNLFRHAVSNRIKETSGLSGFERHDQFGKSNIHYPRNGLT